ncbi:7-methylguanosine phosphate-specific 5'-nucleotidase [Cephus cinctus]|uniref:5'-nucleotidase n=1 Tax=Cephus cinctus TaxID=211228 RepID=A0AAJ7BXN2_CEPCN|nr:7-methylguanosine phosphate-specific 5'-nucleotidase [Cephus cinctus]XP_015596102.1 7-methylguanosine phosphate-specific 5'-nucleotidase [Cephus cinctus]
MIMPDELAVKKLPALRAPHVHMKNIDQVARIINKIIQDGSEKLQIVTDFDLTLTKQHVNGKQVLSSFGIFGKCKQLSSTFTEESRRLYHKYRPIEIDPNIPLESKVKAMEEWTALARDMLSGFEFDAKELDEVAEKYGTALRDGTKHLFERLNIVNVPILVFSAGLGDVVQAVLRHNRVLWDNVKIVSNFLKYKDGKLDGFVSDRVIHVFNKNEHTVEEDYFNILKGRCNVVVMGDSIGDAAMADGVKDIENILKIGFLYDHAEEHLPTYMDLFDIVLVDDQTMNVPFEILKPIL